jgi:hypothetical protein
MSKVSKFLVMLMVVGSVGAAGAVMGGCVVGVSEPAEPVVATSYYRPLYYNGALVYYSDAGLPYYYVNGAAVYIPRTYVGYGRYYNHWRVNRAYYHRWYRSRGYRYRRYRTRAYRRGHRRGARRTHRRGARRTHRRARRR